MDNRDVEEQMDRHSRSSSPTYSSVSNNGNKHFVIIASAAANASSQPADIYEDTRINLARATNFAELSKLRESLGSNSAINIVYMQQDKDAVHQVGNKGGGGGAAGSPVSQHARRISDNQRKHGGGITIAEAMSSTSWDPQTAVVDKMETLTADKMNSVADLYGIRLKVEEKRKRIEADKRQHELMASRQREKVGKAAFLQVN